LSLPANVTLVAPQGATINGNLHITGANTTVQGFTFDGGMVDIGNSSGATVQGNVFNSGSAGVTFNGADNAHIVDNSFNNISGGAVDGWGLNTSTISGNHFSSVTQGINLDFNDDPSRGNDITVDHNTFANTARMPIEVGPGGAYTSNLVISNNYSDNSNLTNQAADGAVAYSIISTNGVNSLIEGNYAKGLPGPGIGIELAGSGEIKDNVTDTYQYGIVVYSPGFNVHDNANNSSIAGVLNYANATGTMQNNTDQPDAAQQAHVQSIDPPADGTTTGTSQTVDSSASSTQAASTTDGTTSDASHTTGTSASSTQTASTADGTTSHATDPSASSTQTASATDGTTSDASHATDPSVSSTQVASTTDGTTADASHATDPSASSTQTASATDGTTADASHATNPSASSTQVASTTDGTTSDASHATDTSASSTQAASASDGTTTSHISFGSEGGQDPALTASSADALQSEYQSVIDRDHVSSIDFNLAGAAEQDQQSITLRDQAIVGVEAANPDLQVSFTLPAASTGLDANALNVLQNAMADGVHIDAVNILVNGSGQSVDSTGQVSADATNAASATAKQLADLGLDAKVGITPAAGTNDSTSGVVKSADAQTSTTNADPAQLSTGSAASDNNSSSSGAQADAAHAHDSHAGSSDLSGMTYQPFEYSGILHHHDHVG
jgi:hypothetical protein